MRARYRCDPLLCLRYPARARQLQQLDQCGDDADSAHHQSAQPDGHTLFKLVQTNIQIFPGNQIAPGKLEHLGLRMSRGNPRRLEAVGEFESVESQDGHPHLTEAPA